MLYQSSKVSWWSPWCHPWPHRAYVHPRQVQPGRTNWKLLAAKWKSNRQHQCYPPWDSGYAGAWCTKKMPQMSSQLQVREETGLCPPCGMVRCLAASHLLTCGRHPIIIHSLHFSQLIDVSTGADNPRLIYIWLWKSLNEFFSKLTFLISFCLGS